MVHRQIHALILRTLAHYQPQLSNSRRLVPHIPGQMFQHMRWDFLLQSDMTVKLIEVNDSPFLGDTTTRGGRLQRERMIFSSIASLTGVIAWKNGKTGA